MDKYEQATKVSRVSQVARVPRQLNFHDTFGSLATHGTSAFTLIEILIGLTIVGMLFSVGFASFRDFSRRQSIASEGKKLQGELRLVQTNAMSGIKPSSASCNPPNVLNSYIFQVMSSTSYEIRAVCSAGMFVIKQTTLPSDVTISTPSVNPISFKVLGQGNNIPSGSTVNIVLTQALTGNTFTVSITSGGEIK